MFNEQAVVARIQSTDDIADVPPSSGPLTEQEMGAAGWLSEALSEPLAPIGGPQPIESKPLNGVATIGDAILNGLMKVSDSYMRTAGEVHSSIENGGAGAPGIMGALQMHMSFIEVSLQADTVSKCISKSEQTIEQLVKLQ